MLEKNYTPMKKIIFLFGIFFYATLINAQTFEADIELRPRFEFRNGYKTLLSEAQESTSFISQRSRLNLNYIDSDFLIKFSVQNIHVWGDVPFNSSTERDGFGLFEAYGQYNLNPDLMIRLGRQVLSYDNQRILGEANWGQAGLKHDAALISWKPAVNHRLDIAAAYNAEAATIIKTPYTLNTYQNMQLAWYHMDVNNVGFSFLLLNTGYEYTSELQIRETEYIQTYGAFHNFLSGNFFGSLGVYGQSGKKNTRDLSAWYAGLDLNYKITPTWKTGIGAEYLSGQDMDDTSEKLSSFTPLFGTNHGFNGHMDYFYTGNHQNSVGLLDIYGKMSYSSRGFNFTITPHVFYAAANLTDGAGNAQDDYLGTEIDFSAGYKVRPRSPDQFWLFPNVCRGKHGNFERRSQRQKPELGMGNGQF